MPNSILFALRKRVNFFTLFFSVLGMLLFTIF